MDQHIINKSKTRRKNLAMEWIDYKMAKDMIPRSWIIHFLKMNKISEGVINFIEKTMATWKIELTAGWKSFAEENVQRGIFQGESLSQLLFEIAKMPQNHILKKCTVGHKLSKVYEEINHLMYMDIKLFAKIQKE